MMAIDDGPAANSIDVGGLTKHAWELSAGVEQMQANRDASNELRRRRRRRS